MAVQWLPFVFGLIGGSALALTIRWGIIEFMRRTQLARFVLNPATDDLSLEWISTPTAKKPVQKINGKPAIPLLKREQKKTFQGRPAFFIHAGTGEAFDPTPGPIEHQWPTARDRLKAWKSIREEKIANAANNDGSMDLLRWGAIGGLVAGGMSILLVVMAWRTFGGL